MYVCMYVCMHACNIYIYTYRERCIHIHIHTYSTQCANALNTSCLGKFDALLGFDGRATLSKQLDLKLFMCMYAQSPY